ncbi:MAG: endonuclease/exonuclease/phosphatase family protein [Gemmatimonadaceae bacterium]|nr:endonuclease/exonuclease/phosphatase family protein [Gemmatimonadaceae bacterium]
MSPTARGLRLVTWNCCRGPLAAKLAALDALHADIAVLQECPKPARQSDQFRWLGDTPRQGVAVIARGEYRLRRLPAPDGAPRYALPVSIRGPEQFSLLAIWAMNDRPLRYVRAVVRTVELHRARLARGAMFVLGDFNSNTVWDREHPTTTNHSALVGQLAALGLHSCYHRATGESHGAESTPTFHLYRHASRPYHLDYCFAPSSWLSRLSAVTIGAHERWMRHSDHRPLIMDFTPPAVDVTASRQPRRGPDDPPPARPAAPHARRARR